MWSARRKRQVGLKDQRHSRRADPGREGIDPAPVARLLAGGRQPYARRALPWVDAEHSHLGEHVIAPAGDVRDVCAGRAAGDPIRVPRPEPPHPRSPRDESEQPAVLAPRDTVRRKHLVERPAVVAPWQPGERIR